MSVRKLNLFDDLNSDESRNSETKNPNNESEDGFLDDEYFDDYTYNDYQRESNENRREDYNKDYNRREYREPNYDEYDRGYNSKYYEDRNYHNRDYRNDYNNNYNSNYRNDDYREKQFETDKRSKKSVDNSDKAIRTRGIIKAFVGTFKLVKGTAKGITNLTKNIGKTLNEQSQPKNRSNIDMKTKISNLNNAIKNKVNKFKQNTKAQVGVLLGLSAVALGLVFLVLEKGLI